MAKKGKYLQQKPVKGFRWKKPVVIILAALLLLVGGICVFGVSYYHNLLDYVSRAERQEQELSDEELEKILGFIPETLETTSDMDSNSTKPTDQTKTSADSNIVNLMIVGQARRENEDSKLSDTMILCTVNMQTKTLTLTSFLRDTYVKLPNYKNHICGMQRINVAYNLGWRWAGDLGGMEMLDQLILENFGVEVDHNVEIDFESFVKIIDHLGGVTLELTKEEANYLNGDHHGLGRDFTAGENTLNGKEALMYARMRKSSGSDSDIHRTARQRKIITLLVKKIMKMRLSEMDALLKEILPMVLTDMTNDEITSLMLELVPLLPELTIASNQCPAEGTYYGKMVQIGGMDAAVLVPDLDVNREMLMEICEESHK